MADNCPVLDHFLNSNQCLENFGGVAQEFYIGIKSDLSEPMTLTDNEYSTPKFKSGKGLYKFETKENVNKIEGSSLGRRKGFKLTGTFVLDSVNKAISKLGRGFNNLDLFFIIPDGEDFQIMYSPKHRVSFDADAIKSETGASPSDDRTTTLTPVLQPVMYQNEYVTITDITALISGATNGGGSGG